MAPLMPTFHSCHQHTLCMKIRQRKGEGESAIVYTSHTYMVRSAEKEGREAQEGVRGLILSTSHKDVIVDITAFFQGPWCVPLLSVSTQRVVAHSLMGWPLHYVCTLGNSACMGLECLPSNFLTGCDYMRGTQGVPFSLLGLESSNPYFSLKLRA